MAGGIPIRLRRTTRDVPIDPVPVGGPLWHMIDNKLGIQSEHGMCWYPGIDSKKKLVVLNHEQRLTGKVSSNEQNNLALDFGTQGIIRIVDINTDTVVASFSEAGAVLPNPVVDTVVGGGAFNKGSHPGFLSHLFNTTLDTDVTKGFVGPNTYAWKRAQSSGRFTAGYGYKEGSGVLTHWSAERFTLKFDVLTALQNMGLRSWFFEPALAHDGVANSNKIFVSIFGPQGQSNVLRVGRAGSYASTTILGTGQWQRVALDLPVHSLANSYLYSSSREPYAVDWFYNTTGGTWYLAEPTVQETAVVTNELYQYKTLGERAALADAFFWKSPPIYMQEARKKSIALPTSFPIIHTNANYDVVASANGQNVAVTEKQAQGFVINTADSNPASQWSTRLLVGYRGPLTDIS